MPFVQALLRCPTSWVVASPNIHSVLSSSAVDNRRVGLVYGVPSCQSCVHQLI